MRDRSFSYIVFDRVSGNALGHGKRAMDALVCASRTSKHTAIEIVFVGDAPDEAWKKNVSLTQVRRQLNSEVTQDGVGSVQTDNI